MPGVALKVDAVSKDFSGTRALDEVSFEVAAGTFHALLGGNGSGKSTLIKILAGVLKGGPGGTVTVAGSTIAADAIDPAWARDAGIHVVHQDLGLFEPMTVAENICLANGFETTGGAIHWSAERAHAEELFDQLGVHIDPKSLIASLSPTEKTMVAIARALDTRHAKLNLLVLDEPTARLPRRQVEELLELLERLTAAGTTVLYVTHRLGEVLRAADSLTVFRDGQQVSTRPVAGLDEEQLVELIVGRRISAIFGGDASSRTARDPGSRPVLQASGLSGGAVFGVDLSLGAGEILGIGGAVGSGRSSLLRLLFGAVARRKGSVWIGGEPEDLPSPAAGMRAGVAYVPEDRAADAAFMTLGLTENLSAATLPQYVRRGWLRRGQERSDASRDVETLAIKAASVDSPLQSLSGGNQQKVILGRWLRHDTKVLLLDEPTQGVDVGARAEIYKLIRGAASDGVGVILVSSDFEELVGLSSRILVLADGRIVAEARSSEASADWVAAQTHAATTKSPA